MAGGARGPELTTPRLLLRRWRAEDLEPLVAINSDPEVMAHFPAALTRTEAALLLARLEAGFERDGFGFWAVELREERALAGFVGIATVGADLPFAPAVEVGWRLAREHWGQGIATEAARAALDYGFAVVGAEEIVAYTTPANLRSRRVMERLGMRRDPAADFDHPRIAPDSPQRRHVLYRLSRAERAVLL